MSIQSRLHHGLIGLAGALAIGALTIGSAGAANTVTQQINAGTFTASITDAALPAVTYSNSQQTTTGVLTLDANDARGASTGWNVQVSSSNFAYGGTSPSGVAIPNTGFSITTSNAPTFVAGQAIDVVNGPVAVSIGALNAPVKTINSKSGFGSGDYHQALAVSLVIPATSQTGLYTATLTVAITNAP